MQIVDEDYDRDKHSLILHLISKFRKKRFPKQLRGHAFQVCCRGYARGCVEVGQDHGGLEPRNHEGEEGGVWRSRRSWHYERVCAFSER